MNIEIISIGTEITTGETINTNASYISRELLKIGLEVNYQTSVSDDPDKIKEVLGIGIGRADLIITTGGLGPTEDDMTKEILADFLELEMFLDENMKNDIENRLKKYDIVPENNYKQAQKIVGSNFLTNKIGTAPGTFIKIDDTKIFLLPGPPREMKAMLDLEVIPLLKSNDYHILSRTIHLTGIGESLLETKIKDLLHLYEDINVATFSRPNQVDIRIIGRGKNKEELKNKIDTVISIVEERFSDKIYSYDEETIEEIVFNILRDKNLKIGFCESCTGGLVSGTFARIPGVSEVFDRSIVTYSNKAKMKEVKVKEDTLIKHGAVSEETAYEMAKGLISKGLDISVSITGIAGPDSDDTEKPVGLVYICLMSRDKHELMEFNFNGSRQEIQDLAVTSVFYHLREFLLKVVD